MNKSIRLHADLREPLKVLCVPGRHHLAPMPQPDGGGKRIQGIHLLTPATQITHEPGGHPARHAVKRQHLKPLNQRLSLPAASVYCNRVVKKKEGRRERSFS